MAAPYYIPSDKLQPKPDYTPHVTIDLEEGLVAGNAVTVNGHRFLVQAARFDTHGEVRATLHGADSITRIISQLDLTLVHADWAGCPAVEAAGAADQPTPHDAAPWSVWSTGSNWWVFHAPSGHFLPLERGSRFMVTPQELVELGGRPIDRGGAADA